MLEESLTVGDLMKKPCSFLGTTLWDEENHPFKNHQVHHKYFTWASEYNRDTKEKLDDTWLEKIGSSRVGKGQAI